MIYWRLGDDGCPVQLTGPDAMKEASRLMEDASRIVKQEDVGDYWVSTVFLPMALSREECFETMAFGPRPAMAEIDKSTCGSLRLAKIQHELMVEFVKRIGQ